MKKTLGFILLFIIISNCCHSATLIKPGMNLNNLKLESNHYLLSDDEMTTLLKNIDLIEKLKEDNKHLNEIIMLLEVNIRLKDKIIEENSKSSVLYKEAIESKNTRIQTLVKSHSILYQKKKIKNTIITIILSAIAGFAISK